jgi:membrane-associated protein
MNALAARLVQICSVLLLLLGVVSIAQASGTGDIPDERGFWEALFQVIITFDSNGLFQLLRRPDFAIPAIIAVNLIVFVETGLLVGFFLPGDSLLVTVGLIAATSPGSAWNLPMLLTTISICAIVGDTVGYSIGYKTGPMIFNREKSLFFKKEHLLATQRFYERHGGKTIILARFMPFARTFAPVVAGVGKMEYRRFLMFNVVGGIGWVVSMILIGYYLPTPLKVIFGEEFQIERHVDKLVVLIVFLSILPGIIVWLKSKLARKRVATAVGSAE